MTDREGGCLCGAVRCMLKAEPETTALDACGAR